MFIKSCPDGTISCILCSRVLSYENKQKKNFFKHLKNEHDVHINLDLILAINSLENDVLLMILNEKGQYGLKEIRYDEDCDMQESFTENIPALCMDGTSEEGFTNETYDVNVTIKNEIKSEKVFNNTLYKEKENLCKDAQDLSIPSKRPRDDGPSEVQFKDDKVNKVPKSTKEKKIKHDKVDNIPKDFKDHKVKASEDIESQHKRGKGKTWVETEVFETAKAWLDYEKYIVLSEFQRGNAVKGKKSSYQVYLCKFKRKAGYAGCEYALRAVINSDTEGVVLENYDNVEHNHCEVVLPEKFKWTMAALKIVQDGMANTSSVSQILSRMEEANVMPPPKIVQVERKIEILQRRMTK